MANVYSRAALSNLPTTDNDLTTTYSSSEQITVATQDNAFVSQVGILQYMIHEFKNSIGSNTFCEIEWEGKSELAPSASSVYLQIYNRSTGLWETVDVNSSHSADINFELTTKIVDATNYKDSDNRVTCRVYQLAI